MATTYEACSAEVQKLIETVMRKYHTVLTHAEVSIDAVFARAYDGDQNPIPAVKMHGATAAAKIAITSLQDRARGISDAKLTIDGHMWDTMHHDNRVALLDHELEHLIAGEERDDLSRPKLKMRKHDYVLMGFESILQRHGNKAIEHREMTRFQATYGQLFLPGIENNKPAKE